MMKHHLVESLCLRSSFLRKMELRPYFAYLLVFVIRNINGQGLPFEVNNVPSCQTVLRIQQGSISGVTRGDENAPCFGYLQYVVDGQSNLVCSDKDDFSKYAAERACYTTGANFHRNGADYASTTREMKLLRCFWYNGDGVDSTEDVYTEVVEGTSIISDSNEAGCDINGAPGASICFDDCYIGTTPSVVQESSCDSSVPFWAVGCADINECLNGVHDNCTGPYDDSCTIRKACGENTECTNHIGSFECICAHGYWSENGPMDPYEGGCVDIDECLPSPCDVNADCENTPGSFKCECKDGYSGDGLTCTELPCETLPDIPNAVPEPFVQADLVFDTKVMFTCFAGYHVPVQNIPYNLLEFYGYNKQTTFELSCGEDRKWEPSDPPHCTPVLCGDPGVLPNSVRTGSSFLYDQEVTFTCKTGYHIEDEDPSVVEAVSKCQADGTWSGGVSCVELPCETLPDIPNATPEPFVQADLVFDTKVMFTCSAGHHVPVQNIPYNLLEFYGYNKQTTFELSCGKEGKWEPSDPPHCTPVLCGDPGIVPDSVRTGSSFLYNQEVSYMCKNGYHIEDEDTSVVEAKRTCQADGTWSEAVSCVDIDECTDNSDNCESGTFCVNTVGSFVCLDSYPEACTLSVRLGLCQNGKCEVDDDMAKCTCDDGYEGSACENKIPPPQINKATVIGVVALSIGTSALVFLTIYMFLQRKWRATPRIGLLSPGRAYPSMFPNMIKRM